MKTKEERNVKALTDEELTGVHGGMKIILIDRLKEMQEIIKKMMQTTKDRISKN